MYWFYGIGALAILAGFLLYDYFSDRPKKSKPKKLRLPKEPRALREVQETARSSFQDELEIMNMDEHYRTTCDPEWQGLKANWKTRRDFYQHSETNEIYVIEVNYDGSLVGSYGPIGLDILNERSYPFNYECSPERNKWLESNNENLFIVLFQ